METQRTAHLGAQKARLIRHMVQGSLEPRDIGRLIGSFDRGWQEGVLRALTNLAPRSSALAAFMPLGTGPRVGALFAGRYWHRRELIRKAGVDVALGKIVTVLCLSPTAWYHQHRFESAGFWMQRGGVFGRSLRDQALIRPKSFVTRVSEEVARIAKTRPIR